MNLSLFRKLSKIVEGMLKGTNVGLGVERLGVGAGAAVCIGDAVGKRLNKVFYNKVLALCVRQTCKSQNVKGIGRTEKVSRVKVGPLG